MSAVNLAALQFLQASLGCVLAGCAAWAILALACRRWPALAMSRTVWLLAQALTVAALLIVLAPQRATLSVMPVIELEPVHASAIVRAPIASLAEAAPEPSTRWLDLAAQGWLAIYLAGTCGAILRLMLANRALRRLVHGATALTEHAGFDGAIPSGLAVLETELPVSPMLIGVWRPVLLLPRHLRDFDIVQQQMIVAHELTHLRRRDPLWMAASIAAQTALWFNPAMRGLGSRLTWAQELGCDRQVLASRPQLQRRAYAAALLGQFKLQRSAFGGALAFGGFSATSVTARMQMIRDGSATAAGLAARAFLITAFGVVLASSVAFQPAFAWRVPVVMSPAAPAAIVWRAPLEHARVSSFFGVVSPLRPNGHRGIDFIAKTGTPVLASADGKVVGSTDLDPGGAKFGKTILIAHADGRRTLYAHLDRRLAASGDIVKAGQVIGLSGATGKVTGPHLHFEVQDGGEPVNPESAIAGLDANATPSARRSRPH